MGTKEKHGRFLSDVELRNPRKVYRTGSGFLIRSEDGRGKVHESEVPEAAVSRLFEEASGRTVDVNDAVAIIKPFADELNLRYTYGHKLRYLVQDVLIALVAEGTAEIEKEGRGFVYSILSSRDPPPQPTSHEGADERLQAPSPSQEGARSAAFPLEEEDTDELISKGEGEKIEFKASARWDHDREQYADWLIDEVIRSIASLLNARGGVLLIGVEDDGTIVGIENDVKQKGLSENKLWDNWLLRLRNKLKDSIGNQHWHDMRFLWNSLSNHMVARVEVRPARNPVWVKERNDDQFFIRTANATQKLRASEAQKYISENFE